MMNFYNKTLLLVIVFLALYYLFTNFYSKDMPNQTLQIVSSVFANNQSIPAKYTCDGADVIPPLKISGISQEAKNLVLIVDDPDAPAGIWDHWVKFDIPVSGSEFDVTEAVEPSGVSGVGSSGKLNYQGPCPPDKEHRYFFKAYTLDSLLGLNEGASKAEVENAMQGHILQQAELVGLYNRPQNQ